jgi:phosphoribosylformylglycinamidine (FGAM) synthase-like enzyme
VRPVYGPLPGSITLLLDAAPDVVIVAAQHEVRAAGLAVASVAADEGYLETDWYDVVAKRTVSARAEDFDHTVKLRLFADPTAGRTRFVAECVVRIAYDPSQPERDLERMVPDSTPAHALLDSLIARLKVVFPPPKPRADSTSPREP